MRGGFAKIPTNRGLTIPTEILEDERISMGAKGLYIQILFSNQNIKSMEELTEYSCSTKEEINALFSELVTKGFVIIDKNNNIELVRKPKSDKVVAKTLDEEKIKEATEVVKEPEKVPNAYEKMINMINNFELATNVKQILITYFEKWLNKKGRYATADDLHGATVRRLINELISFHISDDDMIQTVQQSIDKEWFKFVPVASTKPQATSSTPASNSFDIANIKSGTFTKEDIEEIKRRANEMGGTY